MRAIVLDPANDPWLTQRRRLGLDRFDEVWDGVLHVVPAPNADHQRLEGLIELVLRPIAVAAGLEILHNFSIYDPSSGEQNYRTPDIVVAESSLITRRGVEGRAELVIEILSPNDESYDKLAFYAQHGTREMWIVNPVSREVEVFVLHGNRLMTIAPEDDGSVRAPRLGLTLRVIDGPKLHVAWPGGSAEL